MHLVSKCMKLVSKKSRLEISEINKAKTYGKISILRVFAQVNQPIISYNLPTTKPRKGKILKQCIRHENEQTSPTLQQKRRKRKPLNFMYYHGTRDA